MRGVGRAGGAERRPCSLGYGSVKELSSGAIAELDKGPRSHYSPITPPSSLDAEGGVYLVYIQIGQLN